LTIAGANKHVEALRIEAFMTGKAEAKASQTSP
jgi:hypothetical protein